MADYVVGDIAIDSFDLVSAGQTVDTNVASFINGAPVTWNPTIVDAGLGHYTVSVVLTSPGVWFWRGYADDGSLITFTYHVESVAASLLGSRGVTLYQLIHDVADGSQDLHEANADADSSGYATFTSVVDLIDEDNYWRGSEAYFLDGDNAGSTRRVIGSDYETQTITFVPDLVSPIQIGDRVELYNIAGRGLRRQKYANLINRVIREIGGNSAEPGTFNVPTTYDGAEVIPIELHAICQLQYYDSFGARWIEIRRARRPGSRGWWPLPQESAVGLSPDFMSSLIGYTLRGQGYTLPPQLVYDEDRTLVDPEFIVETAIGMAQMSNPDNYQNLGPGQYARNRGDTIRSKATILPASNCARIG